jgi:uncharacterized protein (UPF0212 family)
MKRCKVCNKLTDNGDKRCPKCGTPFEYNPKVNLFSETRILLIVAILGLIGYLVSRAIPMPLPDPTTCSPASYKRFKNIVVRTHNDAMTIMGEGHTTSGNLSKLMQYKLDAEAMEVPACLETAKADFVNYLDALYYTAVPSAWGADEYATLSEQDPAGYLQILKTELTRVQACLPNCP